MNISQSQKNNFQSFSLLYKTYASRPTIDMYFTFHIILFEVLIFAFVLNMSNFFFVDWDVPIQMKQVFSS